MADTITLTHAEWLAEGKRRFGDDFQQWRFVCPVCGNIARVSDYAQYKDKGADPDSATNECIGRYAGNARAAINLFDHERARADKNRPPQPCNYAGYGMFRLSPVQVVREDAKVIHSFAFADAEPVTVVPTIGATSPPAPAERSDQGTGDTETRHPETPRTDADESAGSSYP